MQAQVSSLVSYRSPEQNHGVLQWLDSNPSRLFLMAGEGGGGGLQIRYALGMPICLHKDRQIMLPKVKIWMKLQVAIYAMLIFVYMRQAIAEAMKTPWSLMRPCSHISRPWNVEAMPDEKWFNKRVLYFIRQQIICRKQ